MLRLRRRWHRLTHAGCLSCCSCWEHEAAMRSLARLGCSGGGVGSAPPPSSWLRVGTPPRPAGAPPERVPSLAQPANQLTA